MGIAIVIENDLVLSHWIGTKVEPYEFTFFIEPFQVVPWLGGRWLRTRNHQIFFLSEEGIALAVLLLLYYGPIAHKCLYVRLLSSCQRRSHIFLPG